MCQNQVFLDPLSGLFCTIRTFPQSPCACFELPVVPNHTREFGAYSFVPSSNSCGPSFLGSLHFALTRRQSQRETSTGAANRQPHPKRWRSYFVSSEVGDGRGRATKLGCFDVSEC